MRVQRMVSERLKEVALELLRERGLDEGLLPPVLVEVPRNESFGDVASPLAMQLAKVLRASPMEIAARIRDRVFDPSLFREVEVAKPGFLNFRMADAFWRSVLPHIVRMGDSYGSSDLGRGIRVNLEFVSANPTGPLHVGHGRGAAVGDVMANVLRFAGYEVSKEYYINDAGLQMRLLGRSALARYVEILGRPELYPLPEDGYKGSYMYDVARMVLERDGDLHLRRLEEALARGEEGRDEVERVVDDFYRFSKDWILEGIVKDLRDFGVEFDVWFSERSLYERGLLDEAMEYLKGKGFAYEGDGALWFRSTAFGDEKDRVLVRSNGAPTYFASDVAYHKNKYDRGFNLLVDIWGADHHGYVPRMKAAVKALGYPEESFQVVLIQFVTLLRDGKQVSMSTRSGEFITLREVFEEVGVDAARFFYVMRKSDSHLEFDLNLAKSQSSDNPVYYVQYAHARICSLEEEALSRGVSMPDASSADLTPLSSPEEMDLIRHLAEFPEEVERSARELAPHRVAFYLQELASRFHRFYNSCPVLSCGDERLRDARLVLCEATRTVLANGLRLLGVSAPRRM